MTGPTPPAATAPAIRTLPASVVAHLRSTVTITSLRDAVSELLQNSIDAGAKNVAVAVNLARNSCTLRDDGCGIPPKDMGLVGTQYATSKYPSPPARALFGSRGEALASLATNALVSLTSRSSAYRSTHLVRISYGARIFDGPAPEYHELPFSGTVVRVEGLWGNMPVRLKAQEAGDPGREWEYIKRAVVELLLTPPGNGVQVSLSDDTNRRLTVTRGHGAGEPWETRVLGHAYGRALGGPGWERVKARQNGVHVEGWICTRGAPSRAWQYIFVNNHPLPLGSTLLHTEVNRIFAASSFGTIEEFDRTSSGIQTRGSSRKGVDRQGMFILRIEARKGGIGMFGGEGGTDGKAGVEGENLRQVVDLLQKLVHAFLTAHDFRPAALRTNGPQSRAQTPDATPVKVSPPPGEPGTENSKSAASFRHFHGSARVKSAKFDSREEDGRTSMKLGTGRPLTPIGNSAATPIVIPDAAASIGSEEIFWSDPATKKIYLINARTGSTVKKRTFSPDSASTVSRPPSATRRASRSAAPSKRLKTGPGTNQPGPWVSALLENWKNPTFAPGEAPIPSLSLALPSSFSKSCHDPFPGPCDSAFASASTSRLGRLTKSGLQRAKVIAQVDSKYIVLLLPGLTAVDGEQGGANLLVALDQHAADERVRVEALLEKLCSGRPPTTLSTPLSFSVTDCDSTLLDRYRGELARYGIEYSTKRDENAEEGAEYEWLLEVHALPTIAADRCVDTPVLALEMLRQHIYALDLAGVVGGAPAVSREPLVWTRELLRMPQLLVEMVNSRACRSAIMFNDPLAPEECTVLVEKLARTHFPFICAHGRPTMIPLVDLGVGDGVGGGTRLSGQEGEFVKNWRRWEKSGFPGLQDDEEL